jgi:hypothetical protein
MKYVLLILLFLYSTAHAESVWRLEIETGSAYSFDSTLTIDQQDGRDYEFTADYETRPFRAAPYSAWRVSRSNEGRAWEIEFVHHKIYLENNPSGIDAFQISNGYNLFFVNHVWEQQYFELRAGAGAMIAYPISNIEGVRTDGGYQLSGFGVQASVSRRFYIGSRFFVIAEGKFTVAQAWVDLNNGDATAPNFALHGLFGLGFNLYP